jgi:hypothetical protein
VEVWRHLRFSQPESDPNGSSALTFVIPTGAYPDFPLRGRRQAARAAFREESRMKLAEPIEFNRKSGGAQWRDLRFPNQHRLRMGAFLYPLSSRPERSAVEGSAVLSTSTRSGWMLCVSLAVTAGSSTALGMTKGRALLASEQCREEWMTVYRGAPNPKQRRTKQKARWLTTPTGFGYLEFRQKVSCSDICICRGLPMAWVT